MNDVVLFKIESLHVRTVGENGLTLRQAGQDVHSGPILAHLDEEVEAPGNMGMFDGASGAIQIRWDVVATVPFLADAMASGQIPLEDGGLIRATLEEHGKLQDGDGSFKLKGHGRIHPGSFLSAADIIAHPNMLRVLGSRSMPFGRAIASRTPFRCAIDSEGSHVELRLPEVMGGGTQRLKITGGFAVVPLMSLNRGRASSGAASPASAPRSRARRTR